MAAQLIRGIATIIGKVTDFGTIYAIFIGTLMLSVQIAGNLFSSTNGHIVFIGTVAAIVDTVANLVTSHTTMIGTLETTQCIAIEIGAHFRILIRAIAAVIGAVAHVRRGDAEVVVALKS